MMYLRLILLFVAGGAAIVLIIIAIRYFLHLVRFDKDKSQQRHKDTDKQKTSSPKKS